MGNYELNKITVEEKYLHIVSPKCLHFDFISTWPHGFPTDNEFMLRPIKTKAYVDFINNGVQMYYSSDVKKISDVISKFGTLSVDSGDLSRIDGFTNIKSLITGRGWEPETAPSTGPPPTFRQFVQSHMVPSLKDALSFIFNFYLTARIHTQYRNPRFRYSAECYFKEGNNDNVFCRVYIDIPKKKRIS